jgi:hypothetical protein
MWGQPPSAVQSSEARQAVSPLEGSSQANGFSIRRSSIFRPSWKSSL